MAPEGRELLPGVRALSSRGRVRTTGQPGDAVVKMSFSK
jgi:hypothetical protein